jgi:hypothetical protein
VSARLLHVEEGGIEESKLQEASSIGGREEMKAELEILFRMLQEKSLQ